MRNFRFFFHMICKYNLFKINIKINIDLVVFDFNIINWLKLLWLQLNVLCTAHFEFKYALLCISFHFQRNKCFISMVFMTIKNYLIKNYLKLLLQKCKINYLYIFMNLLIIFLKQRIFYSVHKSLQWVLLKNLI